MVRFISRPTLSLVEILPRLGRNQEALELSGALLAQQPALERAAELRLLRGNIYSEALKNRAAAAREYALAAAAQGPVGTEARRRMEALRP